MTSTDANKQLAGSSSTAARPAACCPLTLAAAHTQCDSPHEPCHQCHAYADIATVLGSRAHLKNLEWCYS